MSEERGTFVEAHGNLAQTLVVSFVFPLHRHAFSTSQEYISIDIRVYIVHQHVWVVSGENEGR